MTISKEEHTVKRFDQELASLRSLVMEMGGLVEDQVNRAIKALDDEDLSTAQEVVARDYLVNSLEVKADEECIRLIALRQPMGSDLRLIMSLFKAITDLERIGDEAEKIARMVSEIYGGNMNPPNNKLLRYVMSMAKLAIDMLHGCLDAMARLDVEKAVAIAQGDEELNAEFQVALRHLVTYMIEDPRNIGHTINVTFMIRALERIGDHAKNIAEYVIYQVKGKDIRHVRTKSMARDILERRLKSP